jgi:hypothetical protein
VKTDLWASEYESYPSKMNYNTMSLVELKQVAKTRHIKMYYTKKRVELIRLVSMPELPDSFKIEKLTILQLREQAKQKGLRGFWKLSRDELVGLLYPTGELRDQVDKEDKNSNNSHQDKNPETENSE